MDFIRGKRKEPHIEMAPLVDIIFLLLIFFMLSSSFIKPMMKMELPKAMHEEKLEKVDIIVTVSKEGEIFINKNEVTLENYQTKLLDRMNQIGKYDVIFRGDRNISYDTFVTILDLSKEAGATSFSVEHEKE